MKYEAMYWNVGQNVTGLVFKSDAFGGYAAQLRDDDSGELLPHSRHGLTFEDACALARKWAGIQ